MGAILTANFDTVDPGADWGVTDPSSRCTIVTDQLCPKSPNNVLNMLYPAGQTGGSGAGSIEGQLNHVAAGQYLYAAHWFKYSKLWQSHPVENKIIHFYNGPDVVNRVYSDSFGSGGGITVAMRGRMGFQSIEAFTGQTLSGGAVEVSANLVNPVITRDVWHCWEVMLKGNTDTNADGSCEWWIDGQKCGEYLSKIKFIADGAAAICKFQQAWLSATWGGAGSTVSADMTLRTDHLYLEVSDTPITRPTYRNIYLRDLAA